LLWGSNKINVPILTVYLQKQKTYKIEIEWGDTAVEIIEAKAFYVAKENNTIKFKNAICIRTFDPQRVLNKFNVSNKKLDFSVKNITGNHTFFITLEQNEITWTQPINFFIKPSISITSKEDDIKLNITVTNNSSTTKQGLLAVNGFKQKLNINAQDSLQISIPAEYTYLGSNKIAIKWSDNTSTEATITNWNLNSYNQNKSYQTVNLQPYFNDGVAQIFKNKYLSPRPQTVTLQIPWQGFGNWCYPLAEPVINDSGMRMKVTDNLLHCNNIPFQTIAAFNQKILYTLLTLIIIHNRLLFP